MKYFYLSVVLSLLVIIAFSAQCLATNKQGQDRKDSLLRQLNRHSSQDTATVNTLTELAFEYENSDPDKGIQYADQAGDLAVSLKYQAGIGRALLSKGVCYYAKSEDSKALMLLFQALKLLQLAGDMDNVATVYLNIGNIYFNESDFTRTLNYYQQALKILEELGNKSRCASVYGNIGNVYYVQSDFPKSLEYQFKSLQLAEKSGNMRVQANALSGIGNIYSKLPDYPKSLEYFYRSLKIHEAVHNKKGLASSYGNIGIIYYRQQDFNKAIANFQKAGKFCEEIDDKRGSAITYTNLGNVYADQLKYTEALKHHLKAEQLFRTINSKSGMASALGNIGNAYAQIGEYQKSLTYYYKALDLNRSLEIKSGIMYDLKGLGALYYRIATDTATASPEQKPPGLGSPGKDNLQNAIQYSQMAVAIGKEVDELAPLIDAYNIISQSFQKLNDWEMAFQYADSANQLQDSLFSQENQMKISEIETKRINEIKQKEIELFTLNIKHQRIAIAAISGGFALMVLIAILIYRSLRIKKRNNLILEEKNSLITDQKEKIEQTQQKVQSDIEKAKEYVFSLLPPKIDDDFIRTDWLFIPSSQLGGDAFGYYWVDQNHFVFYILDTCGHGIGCALHSISVLNMLRSSLQLNVHLNKPEEVITALNESFLMEEHSDLYFSMWYGVYYRESSELKFVCAGHPPPLIINQGQVFEPAGKCNIPVGWYSGYKFSSQTMELTPGTVIYLFSDGVYEIQKPDGKVMIMKEFTEILAEENRNPDFSLNHLIDKLKGMQGMDEFRDDLSILKIDFK
ncbi:MAG: tetratricopeptide repeat protein [Bacteroidales bacterium]